MPIILRPPAYLNAVVVRLVAGPGPAGNLAKWVQLVVGDGVRVLHRDLRAEFDVFSDGLTKRRIVRHSGAIKGAQVQLDESLSLLLGDLQSAVDGDQLGKAQLVGESFRAAE